MTDDRMGSAGRSGLDDADLVDYLHEELDAGRHARVEQQVSESAELSARLRQLRRREERLRAMLSHLDPDELSVRRSATAGRSAIATRSRAAAAQRRRRLLVAAVVAALLGAGALSVEPVRAALADGLRSVGRVLGLAGEDSTPPPAASPAALVRTTVAWSSPVFTVELPTEGAAVEASVGQVTGAVIHHSPDVPIVVTPAGVRIVTGSGTVSIVLPAGTTLRVIGGGRATEHSLSAEPLRIER